LARRLPALLLVLLVAGLHGCATTEELYAQYDEQDCRVALVDAPAGQTLVRERTTGGTMTWSPVVFFDFDRSALSARAQARLARDVAVLQAYPELRVAVRGHADPVGGGAYNRDLSLARTAAVVRTLTEAGIAPRRIVRAALGEAAPLRGPDAGSDDGPDDGPGVAIDRRVELLLLDSAGEPVPFELDRPRRSVSPAGSPDSPASPSPAEPPFAAARGVR